jgi:hypothetical protein
MESAIFVANNALHMGYCFGQARKTEANNNGKQSVKQTVCFPVNY